MRTKGSILALISLVAVISLVFLFSAAHAASSTGTTGGGGVATTEACNNVCGTACVASATAGSCTSTQAITQPSICNLCESSTATIAAKTAPPTSQTQTAIPTVSPAANVALYNTQNAPWFLTCPLPPSQAASPADSRLFYSYPYESNPQYPNIAGDACGAVTSATQLQATVQLPVNIFWDSGNFANAMLGTISSTGGGGYLRVNAVTFSPMLTGGITGGSSIGTISSSSSPASYVYDNMPASAVNVIWTWSASFADYSGALPDTQTVTASPNINQNEGNFLCNYDYGYSETTQLSSISGGNLPFNEVNVMGTGGAQTVNYLTFDTPVVPFLTFNFFLTDPNGGAPLYSSYDLFSPWNYNTPQVSIDQLPLDTPSGLLFGYEGDKPAASGGGTGVPGIPSSTKAQTNYGMLESVPAQVFSNSILIGNYMNEVNSMVVWLANPAAQKGSGTAGGAGGNGPTGGSNSQAQTNWDAQNEMLSNFGLQDPNVPGPISIAAAPNNHIYVLNYSGGKYLLNVLELIPRGYHNLTGDEPDSGMKVQASTSGAWANTWNGYWSNVIDMQNNTVYVSASIDLTPYLKQFITYSTDQYNCTGDTGCKGDTFQSSNLGGKSTYASGFIPLNISVDLNGDVYIAGNVDYEKGGSAMNLVTYGPGILEIPGLGSGASLPPVGSIMTTTGNWIVSQSDVLSEVAVSPDGTWIYAASPNLGYVYQFGHDLTQNSGKIDLTYTPQEANGVAQSIENAQTGQLSSLDILWWLKYGGIYGVKFDGGVAEDALSPGNNPVPSDDFDLQGYHHPVGIANVNGYLYVLDDWQAVSIGSEQACSGLLCGIGIGYAPSGGTSFDILTLRVLDPQGNNVPISPSLKNDILSEGSCTTTFSPGTYASGTGSVTNPTSSDTGTCFTGSTQPTITCPDTSCIEAEKTCYAPVGIKGSAQGVQYQCVGASSTASVGTSTSTYYSLLSTGQTTSAPTYPPYGWILSASIGINNKNWGFCSSPDTSLCQYTPAVLQKYSFKPIGPILEPLINGDVLPEFGFSMSYSGQATILIKKSSVTPQAMMPGGVTSSSWPQYNALIVANFSVENYTKYFDGSPNWECYTDSAKAAGLGCMVEPNTGSTNWLLHMKPPVYTAMSPFRYLESEGSPSFMTLGGSGAGAAGNTESYASNTETEGGKTKNQPLLTISNKEIGWGAQESISAAALSSSNTITIDITGTGGSATFTGTGSVSASINTECPSYSGFSGWTFADCAPPGTYTVTATETGTDGSTLAQSSATLTIDQTPMVVLSSDVASSISQVTINAFPAVSGDSVSQISSSAALSQNSGGAYLCTLPTGTGDVSKTCGPNSGIVSGSVSSETPLGSGTQGTYTVTASEGGKSASGVFYFFSGVQTTPVSGVGVTLTGKVSGYAVIPYSYSYTLTQSYTQGSGAGTFQSGTLTYAWSVPSGLTISSGCTPSQSTLTAGAALPTSTCTFFGNPTATPVSFNVIATASGASVQTSSTAVTVDPPLPPDGPVTYTVIYGSTAAGGGGGGGTSGNVPTSGGPYWPNPTVNYPQITWSGHNWWVMNFGSFSTSLVTIDSNGWLHLLQTGSTDSEVSTTDPEGYGTYTWVLQGIHQIDPNTVIGVNPYLSDLSGATSREFDIEQSEWGGGSTNFDFVIQPHSAGTYNYFSLPYTNDDVKYIIDWEPTGGTFTIVDANTNQVLKTWTATATRDATGVYGVMTVWHYLNPTSTPTDAVFKSYSFVPSGSAAAPAPTGSGTVDYFWAATLSAL